MMFLFLILILFIIWYFMKNPDAAKKLGEFQNSTEDSKKEALKILNEKFVNGEITEEEYLRKKKLIE
ncbi:SHOCT domain-containing protein [Marinitoga aeolica]|uniref:SHOCT domain-containing protein n=1 Tax=Marinitoga aeolica TaxID=2809031 RepID=A0ABY8PTG8_9BACT|nr:SHOCT domain-containing protein [Marinitoga aeolica]WGS65923.1 SHOCT domain-containing protein [Marinitoga aeolica]